MELCGQLHILPSGPQEMYSSTHHTRGWMGPTAGLIAVEKRKILILQETEP